MPRAGCLEGRGLVLTTRDGALKELKSGAKGIVPGDISASAMIERVTTGDLDDRMPPKEKKPLKPSEIASFSKPGSKAVRNMICIGPIGRS